MGVFSSFVLLGSFSVECTECTPYGFYKSYDTDECLDRPTGAEILSMMSKHYLLYHMDPLVENTEREDGQADTGPAESDPASDAEGSQAAQDRSD